MIKRITPQSVTQATLKSRVAEELRSIQKIKGQICKIQKINVAIKWSYVTPRQVSALKFTPYQTNILSDDFACE